MWNPDKANQDIAAEEARRAGRATAKGAKFIAKHGKKIGIRIKDELFYGGPEAEKVTAAGKTKKQAFFEEQLAGLRRVKKLNEKGAHFAKMHTLRRGELGFINSAENLQRQTGYTLEGSRKEVFVDCVAALEDELAGGIDTGTGELLNPDSLNPNSTNFKRFEASVRAIFEHHPEPQAGAKFLGGGKGPKRPEIITQLKQEAVEGGFRLEKIPEPSPQEILGTKQYFEARYGSAPDNFILKAFSKNRTAALHLVKGLRSMPKFTDLVDIRAADSSVRKVLGAILITRNHMLEAERNFHGEKISEKVVTTFKKMAWETGAKLAFRGLADFGKGLSTLAFGNVDSSKLRTDAYKRWQEAIKEAKDTWRDKKDKDKLETALTSAKEQYESELGDIKANRGKKYRYNKETRKYEVDPQWGKRFAGFFKGTLSLVKIPVGLASFALSPAAYIFGQGYAEARTKI